MKKGKAITLLSILCVLMAAALFLTFARFPIGVKNYNSILGAIQFDYDLKGGSAYTVSLAKDSEEVEDVTEVMETIEARLDALGYKAYSVKALRSSGEDGNYDIRIETLNTSSVDSDIATVLAYGTVKFLGGTTEDPTTEIMNKEKSIANSEYISGYDVDGNEVHQVSIEFTDYGYNALLEEIKNAESTTNENGEANSYYLKVMLGDTTIMNAAQITSDTLAEKTVYINAQSEASGKQMSLQIRTGGLAYKYDLDKAEVSEISAPMGENALLFAQIAVGALIVVAMVSLIVMYRGYGIIASLSMLCFLMLEIGMLVAVPNITVSLAGIIGVVLASLLTVDGLVITIRRIREELEGKKTVKVAVKNGFKRAFLPNLNISVVSGIVALVGFFFLKGAVQSFAITFGIGVVVSFVTSVLLSRLFTESILPLVKNKEGFLGEQKKEEI